MCAVMDVVTALQTLAHLSRATRNNQVTVFLFLLPFSGKMKLVSEMGLNSQNVTSVIDGGVSGETRFPQKSHCQIRAFELFELSEMAAGEQFRLSRRKNIPPKFICRGAGNKARAGRWTSRIGRDRGWTRR